MSASFQVYIRSDKILPVQVQVSETIESLKAQLKQQLGIPSSLLRLSFGGKQLLGDTRIIDSGIHDQSFIDLSLRLQGGVMMEPTLQALARKHNCEKKICRKCYARLPPRAVNCRKKKCGHTNQLRIKKKLK